MSSTLIIVAIVLSVATLQFVLWAVFLRLGLHWMKVPGVTTGRIVLATVLVHLGGFLTSLLLLLLLSRNSIPGPVLALVLLLLQMGLVLAVSWTVIAKVFRISLVSGLVAWMPTLLPVAAMLPFVLLILRPYAVEAFKVSANSMAPTLVGEHQAGVCPTCGEAAFCSVQTRPYDEDDPYRPQMICAKFHTSPAVTKDRTIYSGDRMLVAKYLRPQRWDLVAFRYPEDPGVTYVKRLVGMPGETITIRAGALWADGQELTLPADLTGLEYLSEMPGDGKWDQPLWGTEARPAKLGPDEYFMLGDFSAQSKDARLWENGAPGHPAYAVPADHLLGVVTNIYWPLQRCRAFR